MATTAAGTPFVESSDLVANYPGVSLALANHIDTIGKVLQVVRATDSTNRSTNSATFVDVTGMSVTITPKKSTSSVILIAAFRGGTVGAAGANPDGRFLLTDSSNNDVIGGSGANPGHTVFTNAAINIAIQAPFVIFGQVTPSTISAVTYKLRFRGITTNNTAEVVNGQVAGQIYAIEVAA